MPHSLSVSIKLKLAQDTTMGDLAVNEEFLRSAFKGYDINGDGKVTLTEFKRIMARTGN